ncbi:MAG TPA: hypothetical protein VIL35_13735 [Vicinamibacterales bacterium]|jgi:CDP-diacylglycerol pyrophosphatase
MAKIHLQCIRCGFSAFLDNLDQAHASGWVPQDLHFRVVMCPACIQEEAEEAQRVAESETAQPEPPSAPKLKRAGESG